MNLEEEVHKQLLQDYNWIQEQNNKCKSLTDSYFYTHKEILDVFREAY